MNDIDTARLIAYHDAVCFPGCGEDISTYPIPPDEWEPSTSTLAARDWINRNDR